MTTKTSQAYNYDSFSAQERRYYVNQVRHDVFKMGEMEYV